MRKVDRSRLKERIKEILRHSISVTKTGNDLYNFTLYFDKVSEDILNLFTDPLPVNNELIYKIQVKIPTLFKKKDVWKTVRSTSNEGDMRLDIPLIKQLHPNISVRVLKQEVLWEK